MGRAMRNTIAREPLIWKAIIMDKISMPGARTATRMVIIKAF